MSNEESPQLYAEKMLAITCERLLDVEFGSWLHMKLTDAKAHYILMLENIMLDS